MENFEKVRLLGKGGCAVVYLVKSYRNERLYALKEIQLDPKRQTRTKEHVLKEARILEQLKHPHIVLFLESFFDPRDEYLCILQDYCDGGTLYEKIQDAKQDKVALEEDQILKWFMQIVMAVQYIHSKRVLHRDIKTQNVFLMKNGVAKLGDFGIAKVMDNSMDMAQTCVGTPCYLSPEVCQDMPYSSKADIWAVGCMLYEMCSLEYAFEATSLLSLYFKIVKGEYKPIDGEYSNSVVDMVTKLLSKHPEERPSAANILSNPFIQGKLSQLVSEYKTLQETINIRVNNRRQSDGDTKRPSSVQSESSVNLQKLSARSRSAIGYRKGGYNVESEKFIKIDRPEKPMLMSAKETGNYADDFVEETDSDYSDDFDEDTFEAELVSGENKTENLGDYLDDFEEIDEEEEQEIEDVLGNAADVLQKNAEEGYEEVLVDDKQSWGNSNIAFVREQCREFLGGIVFEKVEKVCKNNQDDGCLRPEFQRIAGSEMLETCFLVNELVINDVQAM